MKTEDLRSLWKNKEFKAALTLVDRLLESEHDCPYLLTKRGMLILLQDDDDAEPSLEDAEKCLLRAHELAPHNLDTLEELAHFYAAVIPRPDRARVYADLFRNLVAKSLENLDEALE